MATPNLLTATRLREVVTYNPDTGKFWWTIRKPVKRMKIGCLSSTGHGAYIKISIDGRQHYAHRLAWLYMTGNWPPLDIDHINQNPLDNRWSNLRTLSKGENNKNRPRGH